MPSSASANPAIYTLSLHDALPIWFRNPPGFTPNRTSSAASTPPHTKCGRYRRRTVFVACPVLTDTVYAESVSLFSRCRSARRSEARSEEHTSELQSRRDLVCRLLLPPTPPSTLFPYTTLFRSGFATRPDSPQIEPAAPPALRPIRSAAGIAAEPSSSLVLCSPTPCTPNLYPSSAAADPRAGPKPDRKSTRLNSSHVEISYAVFCFRQPRHLHSFPTRRSSDLVSQPARIHPK